ncbi:MAG: YraN family protein [Pseudomonadota bacterium]
MAGRGAELYGHAAEDAAQLFYERRGGRVVARRARTAAGEIDLVVAEGAVLVFVEVKARRTRAAAAAALSPRQIARIGQAAEIWMDAAGTPAGTDLRFDVVLSDRDGGIEVLENALDFSA